MDSLVTRSARGIRIFYKLAYAKVTKKRIPLITNILITNRCNLNCFYCFPQVYKRKVRELTTEEILRLIDESKKLGAEIIILLGGEPLLRNDFGTIVDYIKKKNLMCEIITNGYFVNKWLGHIKKIDSFCISIDGNEEENDKNRGKGSYGMAVEALKIAKGLGVFTRIHAVLTKYTLSSVGHLANLARELGAVVTFSQPSEHTEHEALNFSREELGGALNEILAYKRRGFPVGNTENAIKYILKWPFSYSVVFRKGEIPTDLKLVRCQRKNLTCYVDTTGIVYPCACLWEKCNVMNTNFLERGFKEVWFSLNTFDCEVCGALSDTDLNMLLQLNLGNLLNAGRYYIKEGLSKIVNEN